MTYEEIHALFSVRTANCLWNENVRTHEGVMALTSDDLRWWRNHVSNCGKITIAEIARYQAKHDDQRRQYAEKLDRSVETQRRGVAAFHERRKNVASA